jgi:(E)-4-hydroxy-3-methylbut-2-enyl-diphosphate synthase
MSSILQFSENGLVSRRRSRAVQVGRVQVGGGAPVSIQSMTNTDTRDVDATLAQIEDLARTGCEIVRCAVPDQEAAAAFRQIVSGSPLPVVADVHFDYRLAVAAAEAGAACLRINPGTIHSPEHRGRIADCAVQHGIPVRIGVNSGSLEKDILEKHGRPNAAAMVESALRHCRFFEERGCSALKVSLKTSNVASTVAACRLFAADTDYPLHLGVTEAGTAGTGTVKSAVALGALLLEGIGDTIRVSLTAPPREEVVAARQILEAAGLREAHPEIISCPTCGRTEIDLLPIVTAVEEEVAALKAQGCEIDLRRIAIMGCVVNGPGEARDADLGIAGGRHKGVLFKEGRVVRSVSEAELIPVLLAEIRAHAKPKAASGTDA